LVGHAALSVRIVRGHAGWSGWRRRRVHTDHGGRQQRRVRQERAVCVRVHICKRRLPVVLVCQMVVDTGLRQMRRRRGNITAMHAVLIHHIAVSLVCVGKRMHRRVWMTHSSEQRRRRIGHTRVRGRRHDN
jgi:hypothetical protein